MRCGYLSEIPISPFKVELRTCSDTLYKYSQESLGLLLRAKTRLNWADGEVGKLLRILDYYAKDNHGDHCFHNRLQRGPQNTPSPLGPEDTQSP